MKSTLYKSSIKNINSLFSNKYLLFTIIAIILVGIMYVYKENIIEGLTCKKQTWDQKLSDDQKTFIKSTINLDNKTNTNQRIINLLQNFFNNQTPQITNTLYNKIINAPFYTGRRNRSNGPVQDLINPPQYKRDVFGKEIKRKKYEIKYTTEQKLATEKVKTEEKKNGYVEYNCVWWFKDYDSKMVAIKKIDNNVDTVQIKNSKQQPTNVPTKNNRQ